THLGPITQQSLSARLGTTPRSVSALVDGLARAGYVERRPHPSDRRAVLLSLTPLASDMMRRLRRGPERLARELIEAVDIAGRPALERGLATLQEWLGARVRREEVGYRDVEGS